MVKCSICKIQIEKTFLDKLLGTYLKDDKGRMLAVCFECQKKFPTKAEQLSNMK